MKRSKKCPHCGVGLHPKGYHQHVRACERHAQRGTIPRTIHHGGNRYSRRKPKRPPASNAPVLTSASLLTIEGITIRIPITIGTPQIVRAE